MNHIAINGRSFDLEDCLRAADSIEYTKESIAQAGDAIGDFNPIHRYTEAAAELKFPDNPVIGAHLAAIAGSIGRSLSHKFRTVEPVHVKYQTTEFKKPVFPANRVVWDIGTITEDQTGDFSVQVTGVHDNEVKVNAEITIGKDRPAYIQPQPPRLYSEEIKITEDHVQNFCKLSNNPYTNIVPYTHGMAMMPSTLLGFLTNLNRELKTNVLGANIKMKTKNYDKIELGDAVVDVYKTAQRGKGSRVLYTFETVLSQNKLPKIASEITCFANGELDTSYFVDRFNK